MGVFGVVLFLPFCEFIFSLINAGKNPDIKKKKPGIKRDGK